MTGPRECTATLNGVRIRWLEAGTGPPVVLLHGFPDYSHGWRMQWPALVAAGLRVLMPDQRGYGGSERPPRVSAYRTTHLVGDVTALIEHACDGRAAVVGHDWGGVVAWQLAAQQPGQVRRLAILNAPHPDLYRAALRRPWQLRRSWYVLFFQLPGIAERTLAAGDLRLLERLLRHPAHRKAVTESDVAAYRQVFSQPGALTAALNWYRAAARDTLRGPSPLPRIEAPTLVLWGERDPALDVRLLDGLERHVAKLSVQRFPHAGHFVHWSEPDAINAALARFLSDGAPAS